MDEHRYIGWHYISSEEKPPLQDGITLLVRTDCRQATRILRKNIIKYLEKNGKERTLNELVSQNGFKSLMSPEYREWGHSILYNLALNSTFTAESSDGLKNVNVHFYNSLDLAGKIIKLSNDFLLTSLEITRPAVFLSLDDFISEKIFRKYDKYSPFMEIGFSRLFTPEGNEIDFTGRPGKPEIDRQIDIVKENIIKLQNGLNDKVPMIILEDNVRRAKTIHWILNYMNKKGLFNHCYIAGLATCFCVASKKEREKISFDGKRIPLIIGMDYGNEGTDVITTRDFLFDGLVVNLDGGKGRLPLSFLPPKKIMEKFKVSPFNAIEFISNIHSANLRFCYAIEKKLGTKLQAGWFTGGDLVSTIFNIHPSTRMADLIIATANLHIIQVKNLFSSSNPDFASRGHFPPRKIFRPYNTKEPQ